MRKRTAHRWQLTWMMTIGVFVAVGTGWMVQLINQSGPQTEDDLFKNEPDYIIDRFSTVRMTKEGKPAYIISGDKLTHHPVDDSSLIDKPFVNSLSSEHPPMTIRADTAVVDQGNTRVKLNGNVDVVRPASGKHQAMNLKAPTLTVFPDEERMETDAPVVLHLGDTVATGTGMRANNATLQMHLGGGGKITMPPRAAR
ncbi:MAG: LPS export ABC transporter periplasmic protein LptC [Duganella sp.]